MSVGAVLVAAGSGTRLGAAGPKAFVEVAGVPLLVHAARGLLGAAVDVLVVAVPQGCVEQATTVLVPEVSSTELWVVEGGATRQASVWRALAALDAASNPVDTVVVHDAARAFAPASLVARVVAAVQSGHGAVVPGVPVVDTTKRVGPADATGARLVLDTPDRADLVAVQTPQGFDRALLTRAHTAGADRADDETTAASDDAGLVEALGAPVWVVAGDDDAWKITTGSDLERAERMFAPTPAPPLRLVRADDTVDEAPATGTRHTLPTNRGVDPVGDVPSEPVAHTLPTEPEPPGHKEPQ